MARNCDAASIGPLTDGSTPHYTRDPVELA
jgi:hypothetical protein